ncbi:MAG: FAD-dependent oxidoreductase [Clostridia bacterium]|nr:FAD-dependent oxidoreductase [Clostridia bacterium]
MESIWNNPVKLPDFKALDRDIKTDVLIIGGGIAGLLCLNRLSTLGVDCMLVEADTICSGITQNTTAKITIQHGLVYNELIKKFGIEKASAYLNANKEALYEYRKLCKKIDCDFEEKDSYVYSTKNPKKLEKELNALDKLNFKADFIDNAPLPVDTVGAIKFRNQAQFNPLKFIAAISDGMNIYEHTKVREIKGNTALTGKFKIEAEKIIIATHFPFINKHGLYFLKMYQHRSYVLALENAEKINGMYVDEDEKGMSFRNYGDYLLVGGGGHQTGKKGGNWRELREFLHIHYPDSKEIAHWATQDCMTLDSVPYIGKYSENTDNLFVATGFNKWGMTSSMVSAIVLSDLVRDKISPYGELFDPSRSILHPQLILNAFTVIGNLLYPTVKRCPHLGCALKWNPVEHTWDCPCHGSRFEENGNLIDNPATGDMKK